MENLENSERCLKKIKIDLNSQTHSLIETAPSISFEKLSDYCTENKIDILAYNDYWLIDTKLLTGTRDEVEFKKIDYQSRVTGTINYDLRKKAAANYKIHFMPKKEELLFMVKKLINIIIQEKLFDKIHVIKFIKEYNPDSNEKNPLPAIVIAPASSKETVQKLLNVFYTHLKGYSGSNITPRFNAKVTDLLYIAQGDGKTKEDIATLYKALFQTNEDPYFEQPDCIYYKHDFAKKDDVKSIYYLHHPENVTEWLTKPN